MTTYRSELTPLSFLRRSAAVFPDRIAVVQAGRRLTYRELDERAGALAGALVAAGIEPGDRVAVLAPNSPALLEAHYGVPAAGAALVALNVRLGDAEIAAIVGHSGARLLVVDRELEHLAPTGIETVVCDDTGAPSDPYEAFLASGRGRAVPGGVPAHEEETISINYTSGTTGRPKGVMYTHRGAYLNALGQAITNRLGFGSVCLWTLPMFHCNGWCFTWAVTAVGGTHVCLRRIEPPRVWELLEAESVTHFCCAPTVAISLAHDPCARRLDRPVTVTMGGAPPSPTLLERMAELNFRPVHLYGLTETYGPSTVCEWHPDWDGLAPPERARLLARQGVGHVTTGGQVRVVDERGADVPRDGDTLGEVVMRGNTVMKGYFEDEQATAEAFRDGWFHSGDLAVWHPDGYVELRDRAKDIIISGGENISTIEVEQVVVKHPAVLECAVVAIPDERWGERPKAFVTLKPGATATERELIDFCRDRLAHFKCPAAIQLGELPKTSTGKIQKYVLREREWAGRERRIG
ncbi:MAG: AMP-binding protein [Thermoleophilia bacterium]|nr:AMP-binding protein [Thermoleophilia bacterium]